LNLLLLIATVASSLDLRVEIVGDRILRVLLVPRGPVPVVTTTRTFLGCHLEIDVQDSQGVLIGHLGPRASCAVPQLSDFRALMPGDSHGPAGTEVFGAQFDLLAPERVRLGPNEAALQPGQEYQFVVSYHNDDAKILGTKQKRILRERYGDFWSSTIQVRSAPITFKCP